MRETWKLPIVIRHMHSTSEMHSTLTNYRVGKISSYTVNKYPMFNCQESSGNRFETPANHNTRNTDKNNWTHTLKWVQFWWFVLLSSKFTKTSNKLLPLIKLFQWYCKKLQSIVVDVPSKCCRFSLKLPIQFSVCMIEMRSNERWLRRVSFISVCICTVQSAWYYENVVYVEVWLLKLKFCKIDGQSTIGIMAIGEWIECVLGAWIVSAYMHCIPLFNVT